MGRVILVRYEERLCCEVGASSCEMRVAGGAVQNNRGLDIEKSKHDL